MSSTLNRVIDRSTDLADMPQSPPADGQVLTWSDDAGAYVAATPEGGGGSPGGADGSLQFNSGGVLAGTSQITTGATPIRIKAVNGQTANNFEILNIYSGVAACINSEGALYASGQFDEQTTAAGVWIGSAGSARIAFVNGTPAQTWQIDSSGGSFRWFTPGILRMSLDGASGLLTAYGGITTSDFDCSSVKARGTIRVVDNSGNTYASISYDGRGTFTSITNPGGVYYNYGDGPQAGHTFDDNGYRLMTVRHDHIQIGGQEPIGWTANSSDGGTPHVKLGPTDNGNLTIQAVAAGSAPSFVVQAVTSQGSSLQEWRSSTGTALASVSAQGALSLSAMLAPADVPNNSFFRDSSNSGRLSWKSDAGTVTALVP